MASTENANQANIGKDLNTFASDGQALLAPEAGEAQRSMQLAGGYVAMTAKDIAAGKLDVKEEFSKSSVRCQEYFQQFKDMPPDGKMTLALACFFSYLFMPCLYIGRFFEFCGRVVYKIYSLLPWNVISMIFGVALCFFGGTYFATIAAVEAFRQFGGELLYGELAILYQEASLASAAIAVASKEDLDNDGIADFDEMDCHTRSKATAWVAFKAVRDPNAIQKALTFVCTTWLSVLAVLKFQFAKTVTLCLAIAEMLELPICRISGPIVAAILGPDLQKWAYAAISVSVKIIAVCIATYVQSLISGFYSGLRGGSMFAIGLINLLAKYGLMDKCTCVAKKDGKFDPDNSYLDECIGYPLAACGMYFQFSYGFSLPFPWNLIFLPLTIVEYIIRWQVFT